MKADVPMKYRLVEVRARNVKALKAVTIRPDGKPMFKVSGRNGAGKSSVLDTIAMGIGGPSMFPEKPIRAGQEEAEIFIDFGDLKLTRTIVADEKTPRGYTSVLKLEFRNGHRPKEKQTVLDALRGSPIADDPLEFAGMKPKDRFELVKGLVAGFDFEQHAGARADLFEERTATGRLRDRAVGAAASIVVPPDAPLALVDVSAAAAELVAANENNASLQRKQERRDQISDQLDFDRDAADRIEKSLQELRAKIAATEKVIAEAEPLPEPIDTAAIEDRIRNAETINAGARKRAERVKADAEAEKLSSDYAKLTSQIEDLDKQKVEAVKAAKFPIPELSFGDDDILLDGLPFDQASTARKIRVSTALLMAMKPELRVLLVREGSLLDEDARAALEEDAKAHDFVVLMECVGDDVAGGGVVIENGEIANG